MRVVLPAPSGPTSPRILPVGSSAVMPASAFVAPKVFTRPVTRAAGVAAAGSPSLAGAGLTVRQS